MTTLRLQLKSWQSSLPHQAEHATSCLQVKAVRIRTGSAFVRIPLHLHHSEKILQKINWWNLLWNMPLCCTGENLAKYFCPPCPRNLPFPKLPLPLTGLEQSNINHILQLLPTVWTLHTECLLTSKHTKTGMTNTQYIKGRGPQLAPTHAFLRQCTYVTEIPLQLIQALRKAFH